MKRFLKRYTVDVIVGFALGAVITAVFMIGFRLKIEQKIEPTEQNTFTQTLLQEKDVKADNLVKIETEEIVEETAQTTVKEIVEATPIEPQSNEITVVATAYCACERCCGKSNRITATGTKATAGRTIAVDPSVIPYGTKIIIDGHTYIAEDCGGAIGGNKIDIFFDTHEGALNFGRKTIEVGLIY